MASKRQIKGKEFISDLRSGMTIPRLMDKYGLNSEGLRRIFRILISSANVTKTDFNSIPSLYAESEQIDGIRRVPRKTINYPLPICDDIEAVHGGRVLNISACGMQVRGIKAMVGQEKTLMVRPLAKDGAIPFVFQAVCRWVSKPEPSEKTWVSGFEITRISSLDSQELHKLVLD